MRVTAILLGLYENEEMGNSIELCRGAGRGNNNTHAHARINGYYPHDLGRHARRGLAHCHCGRNEMVWWWSALVVYPAASGALPRGATSD